MTDSPPGNDLNWFRGQFATKAGVPLGDVGMLPDQSHLDGGGYHCGPKDIQNIGKFHLPATSHIGSSTEDYSVRQLRDRKYGEFEIKHGSNFASAVDVPQNWRNGGNAAWIRWNNYVVADLRTDPNRIPGLRGLNFTPDGKVKKRYDSNNPGQGIISSTDTVLWHTHLEWWRDSIMNRMTGFLRLLALMDDAIAGRPARQPISAASTPEVDLMTTSFPMFFSCNGVANSPTFLGTPGQTCSWVKPGTDGVVASGQAAKSIRGLIDGKWMEPIYASGAPAEGGAGHTWAAAPGIDRSLINILGDVPPGFEDRAVDKTSLDTNAVVIGVLQGMANNPAVNVTQADVDRIADAVRTEFTTNPIK